MKALLALLPIAALIAGCNTDARVASQNLSKAADMFEINRRIVFYNGITNQYILVIEGRCSIDTSASGKTFTATCRTGKDEFKKHFLGLSDNVTFFAEQLQPAQASAYHYRVIFKPQTILPDVDLAGSAEGLKQLVK